MGCGIGFLLGWIGGTGTAVVLAGDDAHAPHKVFLLLIMELDALGTVALAGAGGTVAGAAALDETGVHNCRAPFV